MYDFAMIGDNVYVGGLAGENFRLINNRFGIIKKIYCITSDNVLKYLADIEMDKYSFPIDMKYVYNFKNIINPIFLDNNIFKELCEIYDVKSAFIAIDDDTNHRLAICRTSENLEIALTISTLN
jgi:hypothetical protein